MWGGKEFHIFGADAAEIRKAREPNERLCRGTESKWLADDRVDFVVLWYCKRSARYGGCPVCNALKVKVASLNLIRHSMGSQWRCLRSSIDVDEENPERCCVTTLASACCARCNKKVFAACHTSRLASLSFNKTVHHAAHANFLTFIFLKVV